MKRLFGILLALGFCLTAAGGCVDEKANCEEACRRPCDICPQVCSVEPCDCSANPEECIPDCSEAGISACVVSCENNDTSPERAECVISAPTCDDIWEC